MFSLSRRLAAGEGENQLSTPQVNNLTLSLSVISTHTDQKVDESFFPKANNGICPKQSHTPARVRGTRKSHWFSIRKQLSIKLRLSIVQIREREQKGGKENRN